MQAKSAFITNNLKLWIPNPCTFPDLLEYFLQPSWSAWPPAHMGTKNSASVWVIISVYLCTFVSVSLWPDLLLDQRKKTKEKPTFEPDPS